MWSWSKLQNLNIDIKQKDMNEQTIIEFKTDPRLNTGETYINEINSIDRFKKKVLYEQATEWAILDMYNKGFLTEKGELLIPTQFEEKYNEEHKNSSCS